METTGQIEARMRALELLLNGQQATICILANALVRLGVVEAKPLIEHLDGLASIRPELFHPIDS